jgi:signal transduction histidine kinase
MQSDPDSRLIATERLRCVFQQLPLTLSVTMLNACLTAVVLAPVTSHTGLIIWLGLLGALSIVRLALRPTFFRRRPEGSEARLWSTVSIGGALAAGGLWGGGLALMFPADENLQLFVAFVIGGMCAGATTVNFTHFPTAAAFILPSTLPPTATLLLQGSEQRDFAALMGVIFAVSLCIVSWRAHKSFGAQMRLQFALRRQRRKLSEANERLTAEIAGRKTIEQTLHQSQKMEAIGHLTGGIAHDFNNLLQVVIGNLNLIRRLSAGNDKVMAYALSAEHAARRGADLTGSLLTYARQQAMRIEPVNVNTLLAEFEPLLLRTLGGTIEFRMALGEPIPACEADPAHFQSAILNLVINARDAMPNGGRLIIDSGTQTLSENDLIDNPEASPGLFVSVSVRDTGEGMTKEVMARVFEPFFTTKEVGKGTGLGLSQVFGFVRQSGGHLRLVSAPGAGTTATICLPAADAGGGTVPIAAVVRQPA